MLSVRHGTLPVLLSISAASFYDFVAGRATILQRMLVYLCTAYVHSTCTVCEVPVCQTAMLQEGR